MNKFYYIVQNYFSILIGSIFVFLTAASLSCFNSPTKSDQTESTINYKGLYGKLVNQAGNPVIGAMVKAIPIENILNKRISASPLTAAASDSVLTDSAGFYSFESLKSGKYNLIGNYQDKGLVVIIKNVSYDSAGTIKKIDTDTLRVPGKITGTVNTDTPDNGGVLCYIRGTTYLSITDKTGSFIFTDIPQGYYNIIYQKERFKTAIDTGIEVISGKTIVIPPRSLLIDPDSIPPAPTGLSVTYDTLNGCARVSWNSSKVSDLAGYFIYNSTSLENSPNQRNALPCLDTFFLDTIFKNPLDTTDRTLIYLVKTIDTDSNLSNAFSKPFTISAPSPTRVRTFFSWKLLNTLDDTASINDAVSIIVNYHNATRKQVKLSWFFDSKDSIYSTMGISNLSGADTIKHFWSIAKKHTIYISMLDEANSIWWDSTALNIIQDTPIPFAGNDTIVSSNQLLSLHGTATQKFGVVNQWQWKFDSGNWNTTSGPDTTILIPDRKETYLCSLSVVDDDGNRGSDEIKIYNLFPGIAAGGYHSLFLSPDGTVWACGYNNRGQLGDGTTTDRVIPYKVLQNVVKIDASDQHSLFLKVDGSAWGCGWNSYSMLGDGTTTDQYVPIKIMTDVKDISSGEIHTFFLKNDGTLWACGSNLCGQLGDGTKTPQKTPVKIMSDVKSMVASEYCHSLILKNDNSLWTCGLNREGQLGDGTTTDKSSFQKIMTDVKAIDASIDVSLIQKTDNSLWACGWNEYGQLGDGTTISRSTPVHIMDDVLKFACGKYHNLVIKKDSSLWIYGRMEVNGTANPTPKQIMTNVQSASGGIHFSIVYKSDGTLWSFGYNQYGQLSDGTTVNNFTPRQIKLPWE